MSTLVRLCIKTLDTAKANKTDIPGFPESVQGYSVTHALCTILYPWAKDVDSFALETRNMHKQNTQFGVQWVLSSEDM